MSKAELMGHLSVAALAFGAALAGATVAAEAADAPPETPDTVQAVVVKGAPTVPLNTTFSAGLISEDTVKELSPGASTTIQTLLNTQPSVYVYTNGPLGMSTTTNFRAFNSGQFSETIDGIGLNDVFNGGVTGQADNQNNVLLTTNDISSVQVYRGINNPAVNGYESLGGTVNYTSKAPASQFGGEASVSAGSFNTIIDRASINTGDYHGLTQLLSFESGSSNGWQQQTPDRNLNAYYAANFKLDDKNLFTARASFNYNSGYEPSQIPLPILAQAGRNWNWPRSLSYYRDHDDNDLVILGWVSKLNPEVTIDQKIFFGLNAYERNSLDGNLAYNQGKPIPTAGDVLPNIPVFTPGSIELYRTPAYNSHAGQADHFYEYRAWAAGYNGSATINLPDNSITVGGNLTYARLISREFFGPTDHIQKVTGLDGNDYWNENDHRTYASIFAQDEVSLLGDRLKVTPGLKYIYASTYNYDAPSYYGPDGSVADTEHFVSPTIGANYTLTKTVSIYAAYGRNVKFPGIDAYYGNTPNNTNNGLDEPLHVKPEYVEDVEFGLRYKQGGLYVAADYYNENFTNTFISVVDPNTGNSTTSNGPSSTYDGVELEVSNDFAHVFDGSGRIFFNVARNFARYVNTSDSGVAVQSNRLAGVPNYLVNLGFNWTRSGWRVSADGRYVGNQVLNDQFSGTSDGAHLGPYFVLNASISKTVDVHTGFGVHQVRLALNADNLLDRKYYNSASSGTDYNGNTFIQASPAAPQSLMATITVAY